MKQKLAVLLLIALFYGASHYVHQRKIVACLQTQGLKVYGTKWCSHTRDLQSDFGSNWKKITYIDCEEKPDLCIKEGIDAYPSATLEKGINSQYVLPAYSVDDIGELSNCASIFQRKQITSGNIRGSRTKELERLPSSAKKN